MPSDFSDIPTARTAFRQLYNQVQSIINWVFNGSRLQKVGNGIADDDAATFGQMNSAISTAVKNISFPTFTLPKDITVDNLFVNKSIQATKDITVPIGTSAKPFTDIYGYVIHAVTSLFMEHLTASLPLKLDVTNSVISEAIKLDSPTEVSGVLPIAAGGTNAITAPLARASLNAGEAKTYTCSITTPLTGTISGSADLITGIVTGTCTITAGVIQVTITP